MKTILITGGAGYVGSHVGFFLAQQGYQIIIVDELLHGQRPTAWATHVHGNINDYDLLVSLFTKHNIKTVIHCAALINIAESFQDPLSYYHANVSGTLTLLRAMHKAQVNQIIFSSSCAVYGVPEIHPMPENHRTQPISPYGQSKLIAEQIIADACKSSQIKSIIFRYFNVAGAAPEYGLCEWHVPEIHLIPRLIQATLKEEPFFVFGNDYNTSDGTCVRDYIHVWDIARAHHKALSLFDHGKDCEIFNIGSGQGLSIKQIIEATSRILKRSVHVNYTTRRPGDPSILVADIANAQKMLNWSPKFSSIEHIVRSAAASYPHAKSQDSLESAFSLAKNG